MRNYSKKLNELVIASQSIYIVCRPNKGDVRKLGVDDALYSKIDNY